MVKKDHDVLRDRLDALSDRIERRVSELKRRGAFSGIHGAGIDDIRRRSEAIRQKLDAAIAEGGKWDILKYELERDFHSLNENVALLEERLDAEAMK